MKCSISGCEGKVAYKTKQVCQKHYFRFMRYGTYELTRKPAKYRYTHSSGYQMIYEPNHPLANKTGYVYEHRKVLYEVYGDSLPDCELCGKETSWKPYFTHVDHINRDKSDNRVENLRVLCNACNSQRDVVKENMNGVFVLEIDGVLKTACEWARHPQANHTHSSIKRRYLSGMSAHESVFGKNKTHPRGKQSCN